MDSSSKRTLIAEVLAIFKEKLKEEHYFFVQGALMKREKSFEEEKRRMEETYNMIIEKHRRYYKKDNDLLYERIEEIENATSESMDCHAEKLRELRDEVSLMVENERKNDEDLEVETGIQATGATGVNNVESSQGEDRVIVTFDDPKSVDTSTRNSSGESRQKELVNPGNKSGIEWSSEDDFCFAFYTDAELCLNAVCALYRQQISGNKFCSMSKINKNRITALGMFLCRDDPENKLKRTISEVGP
ncbi:hypothetical protein CQW23_34513 [Capsicum baccatum]|uniref:Uncharacterized protein n=1 Tax=Capsicum baccatum TaxID=33114 RepID=A0A2G2UYP8_CAPBA|nr:hypothetical protein CQW23_34513 [Capsicum baccatum]